MKPMLRDALPSAWPSEHWTPRAWQRLALPEVARVVDEGRAAVVSAVMGAGKSVLIAEVCALAVPAGRVVVGVPTEALVRQLAATLRARLGEESVGEWYGRRKQIRDVTVCCYPSVGTLREALSSPPVLLVCDEAHQTQGEVVRGAIEALAPARRVGFTATPYRADQAERLELWDELAYSYPLGQAVADGCLVPWRRVTWDGAGDDELSEVCRRMIEADGHGPGVVSAITIADAEGYAAWLSERGIRARAIHSRLPLDEQSAILDALRSGALRCVVHVAMLAEGVDFPWLRWICLRRPVGSRVRFAQEMGRVLRCDEGKAEGVVMDPHDLFGAFGLAARPALGPGAPDALSAMLGPRERAEDKPHEVADLPPAVALDAAMRWAREVLLVLQSHGLGASDRVSPGRWRAMAPSERQVQTIGKMGWAARYLPEALRAPVRLLCEPQIARRAQRGAVSDVLSVLFALAEESRPMREIRRHYRLPAVVAEMMPEPPEDAIRVLRTAQPDDAWR